jgi:hypothetical protein
MPVVPISVAGPIRVRISCNWAVALLLQRDGGLSVIAVVFTRGSIKFFAETAIPVAPQFVEL